MDYHYHLHRLVHLYHYYHATITLLSRYYHANIDNVNLTWQEGKKIFVTPVIFAKLFISLYSVNNDRCPKYMYLKSYLFLIIGMIIDHGQERSWWGLGSLRNTSPQNKCFLSGNARKKTFFFKGGVPLGSCGTQSWQKESISISFSPLIDVQP